MTSMKNVQFLHPLSPLFLSVRMDPNWDPHSRPWTSKLRLPNTPLPSPIPFGILAPYRLYLVDVSMTYHACASHKTLQLKINLN